LDAGSTTLVKYNVTGISDIRKGPKGHLGTPKVVLSFASDANGIIGLRSAEATLEEMVEVVKPTPKPKPKRFTKPTPLKKSNVTDDGNGTTTASGNETDAAGNETDSSNTTTPLPDQDAEPSASVPVNGTDSEDVPVTAEDSSNATAKANATAPLKVMKKVVHRFPLRIVADYSELAVQPMSERQTNKSLRTYVCLDVHLSCGSLFTLSFLLVFCLRVCCRRVYFHRPLSPPRSALSAVVVSD
jgi:hypothetical protein